ncbi:MAG: hypothetical protein HY043_13660 [Verrucomicrobia bacterium]|nr:hypothetical protein [Verrucomicrobiota bacterium]
MKILLLLAGLGLGLAARAAEDKPFIVWNNPPAKPQEFLTHHTYQSAAMKTEVGFNLYLPPGYDATGNTNRYPVIYWCHGMNCHESIDQFPARLVEQAIRELRIPSLIVVYVSGGSQSFYCDSPDLHWASETTITTELIPHIDANYRTLASRDYRAIQGMSMGGFGSMRLALKHPELFSSVVAFAGGYVGVARLLEKERSIHLENMFGGDTNKFIANHPFTLAKQNADRVRGQLGIKLFVGNEDFLLEPNRKMHAALTDAGLPHEYDEVPAIKHDLRRLSEWIGSDGLEFAVKHFAMSTAKDHDGPWVNPPTEKEKVPNSEHHIFWSDAMRRPIGYNIYLPPGYYDAGSGRGLSTNTARYPVVFYLHGMTDSESTHFYNAAHLHQAILDGKLPPMIYVHAYAGRTSWFSDYTDGSVMGESIIVKELIPQIDRRWRTLADREHRSLHGFSMGGSGALKIAAKHPELFSSVVAYSGGYRELDEIKKLHQDQFAKIWNGDEARWLADEPWTLIRQRADALRGKVAIRQVVGTKDFLLEHNRKMHALLNELKLPHDYEEIEGIGHDPKRVWEAAGVKGWAFSAAHFGSEAR